MSVRVTLAFHSPSQASVSTSHTDIVIRVGDLVMVFDHIVILLIIRDHYDY